MDSFVSLSVSGLLTLGLRPNVNALSKNTPNSKGSQVSTIPLTGIDMNLHFTSMLYFLVLQILFELKEMKKKKRKDLEKWKLTYLNSKKGGEGVWREGI